MEHYRIDVRDVDTSWFEEVTVYVDRTGDRFLFPEESIRRLGEAEPDGRYYLLDGAVETDAEQVEIDGRTVPVWSVPIGQLVTRPSRTPGL